ncbi:thioredoxin domain-containing protein [Geobacter hydrogenophilus]|uniref:Thioredoxin n=1 Tax=Geobacter hydrogenophilus TaxID=40983 RepID=A0A9W6LDC8_9BACT|nr:thioredoxin domain-containing protein [Geobacter hydrogenophilus]MBT0892353.1 thioredoxin domain-containing protein [Geobacter hydrogenophilus]GLI39747.1 thioredoxin [Geobacter hydrogenophilus]
MEKDPRHDEQARLKRIFSTDRDSLPPDGGEGFNRLIFASSPYLLQHADNPVEWYEWGEEAFARAQAEDKSIFLSIGYATCHWCHVMAHESFEDDDVAAVLNRDFVAIKVDREERPDIDDTYMRVAQLMNGSGGWPLTVCMTPDREPFFVATYIPKHSRGGMPGLIEILGRIAEVWKTRRELVRQNCTAILGSLRNLSFANPGEIAGDEPLHGARSQLGTMYDPVNAGFGQAPKFPMPLNLSFLLRYGRRFGDAGATAMVVATLAAMRRGGIFDQLGFGLHRYSVDSRWLVPHFEKMLYDQALVATAAVEAFQATGREFFRKMAAEICDFVLRELVAPEGGFYSALDADTEGEEGRFYLWTPAQVRSILGEADGDMFCRLFDVTEKGNFEEASILNLPGPLHESALREGVAPEDLDVKVHQWRSRLLAEREQRVRPFRDEKIVTAWNGLMIAALARVFLAGGGERFLVAAEAALERILRDLRRADGRLLRSIHRGEGEAPAFLEDYAALIHGLLALHEATLDSRYREEASSLAHGMLRLFSGDGKGLYDTGNDAEAVLMRGRETHDGVMPSGNALASTALIRLGRISGEERFVAAGEEIVSVFMEGAGRQPAAHLQTLMALDLLLGPEVEVTISGGSRDEVRGMLAGVGRRFIPGLVLREEMEQKAGIVTARVCAVGTCHIPADSPAAIEEILNRALDECYPPPTQKP